ncbi:MAG: hypothetical protein WC732_08585 [Candidatus Omnitrophota bacterium]
MFGWRQSDPHGIPAVRAGVAVGPECAKCAGALPCRASAPRRFAVSPTHAIVAYAYLCATVDLDAWRLKIGAGECAIEEATTIIFEAYWWCRLVAMYGTATRPQQ